MTRNSNLIEEAVEPFDNSRHLLRQIARVHRDDKASSSSARMLRRAWMRVSWKRWLYADVTRSFKQDVLLNRSRIDRDGSRKTMFC